LGALKQSLFHWTFFAGRGELEHGDGNANGNLSKQQLEEISDRVTAFSSRIEEALSSSK